MNWCIGQVTPVAATLSYATVFGTEAYASEELIAELDAAFLCAELGISPEPHIDHARYIESWLRILKDDKRSIFTAAAKANQAVAYLQSLNAAQISCV